MLRWMSLLHAQFEFLRITSISHYFNVHFAFFQCVCFSSFLDNNMIHAPYAYVLFFQIEEACLSLLFEYYCMHVCYCAVFVTCMNCFSDTFMLLDCDNFYLCLLFF